MRGMLGVLLLGGILAIVGVAVKRNRRTKWETLLARMTGMFGPRMFRGLNIARMAKKGRRIIRNLNWA